MEELIYLFIYIVPIIIINPQRFVQRETRDATFNIEPLVGRIFASQFSNAVDSKKKKKKKKRMATKELRRKGRSRISVRTCSLETRKITKCGSRAR